MTDQPKASRAIGWIAVPLLLLYALAYAAVPFIAAAVIVALIPGFGDLRASVSAWSLFHLLWALPAMVLLESISSAAVRIAERAQFSKVMANVVGASVVVLALAGLFSLLFDSFAAAALAAIVGFGLSLIVQKMIPEPISDRDA